MASEYFKKRMQEIRKERQPTRPAPRPRQPEPEPPFVDWCTRMLAQCDHVKILPMGEIRALPQTADVGIYFLWDKDRLSYIGKSTDIYARCRRHENEFRIDFDRYTALVLSEAELKDHERAYIAYYKPPYNFIGDNPGT